MGIFGAGREGFENFMKFLKKIFRGKTATTAELKQTARNLGLNENEVENVIAAYKSEDTTDLNKMKGIIATDDSAEAAVTTPVKAVDDFDDGKSYSSFEEMQRDRKVGRFAERPEDVSNYDELVEAGIYEPGTMNPGPNHPDVKAGIIEGTAEPIEEGIAALKGPVGRNNSDEVISMKDGIERSIKFVGERTGLPDSIVKKAIRIKMAEPYAPNDPKRLAGADDDMMLAYIDNQVMGDDTLEFLEEIEEIGNDLIEERGIMGEAFDNAMDASKGDEMMAPVMDDMLKPSNLDNSTKVMKAVNMELREAALAFDEAVEAGDYKTAEAIGEEMKRLKASLENTGQVDMTYQPPGRSLNAGGGLISPQPMNAGIGQMFKKI
jgi:hypothetical protein